MLDDDFVETDGGVHNMRVMNNRGVNAAHGGYSAQPVFGGPVYFIGNLLYHVPCGVAFKFSRQARRAVRLPQHDHRGADRPRPFVQHALSEQPVPWPRHAGPRHYAWANATDAFSSDYNGFRPNKGVSDQYPWLGPKNGQRRMSRRPRTGRVRDAGRFRAATGQETHGIEVDFDIFER